ncbi:hypothetical protein HN873_015567, partial [Arachis hypogaea]
SPKKGVPDFVSNSHDYLGDNFYGNWDERSIDEIADLKTVNFKELTANQI